MHKGGRGKQEQIDLAELEKLCSMNCTDEELAAWFGCSSRTIERKRKGADFLAAMERGKAKGRISIRRAQMKLAEAGNATMCIWLGKQLLGQRDQVSTELTGKDGGPMEQTLTIVLPRVA